VSESRLTRRDADDEELVEELRAAGEDEDDDDDDEVDHIWQVREIRLGVVAGLLALGICGGGERDTPVGVRSVR